MKRGIARGLRFTSGIGFVLMFLLWFVGLRDWAVGMWVTWHVAYWLSNKVDAGCMDPVEPKRQPRRRSSWIKQIPSSH